MDHDSGERWSQLSPLDWQKKTSGVEKQIQSCEKVLLRIGGSEWAV